MRKVIRDDVLGTSKVIWDFKSSEAKLADDFDASSAETMNESLYEQKAPFAEGTFINNDFNKSNLEGDIGFSTDESEPLYEDVDTLKSDKDHLSDLQNQIQFLQKIVEEQSAQLKTKDELIRNFQVLLKAEQEQVLQLAAQEKPKMSFGEMLKKVFHFS